MTKYPIGKIERKRWFQLSIGAQIRKKTSFFVGTATQVYHNIGTSICAALIFERAGGTSKPGPPLASRNSSSVHGATPYGGSLL